MSHSEEMSALLDICTERARNMRGTDVVPYSVTRGDILEIIRSIDTQYWDLKKSGLKIGYTQLTKRVCEARVFSEDPEENWVLQYAYQVVAMIFFGNRSKKNALKRKDRRLYLSAQEEECNGRESLE